MEITVLRRPVVSVRRRELPELDDLVHHAPFVGVVQVVVVSEEAGEREPLVRIHVWEGLTAEEQTNLANAVLERNGCIVKGGGARAENADALAAQGAEVDVFVCVGE